MAENDRIPSPNGDAQSTTRSSDALGDMLSRLMAHPEVISYVASALGVDRPTSAAPSERRDDIPTAAPTQAPPPVTLPEPPTSVDSGPRGDDVMASIAPLLSGLSGLSKGIGAGESGKGEQKDCRAALLLALKPYVSHGRCEAIDYMLRFSKLTDLLKTLH